VPRRSQVIVNGLLLDSSGEFDLCGGLTSHQSRTSDKRFRSYVTGEYNYIITGKQFNHDQSNWSAYGFGLKLVSHQHTHRSEVRCAVRPSGLTAAYPVASPSLASRVTERKGLGGLAVVSY
jgi:hypothetical protein